MQRLFWIGLFSSFLLNGADPVRPKITGLPQVAFYTSNAAESTKYYRDFLGFEQVPGSALIFKINDRQYVELVPEKESGSDRFSHLYLQTDDVEGMRKYLSARGVAVPGVTKDSQGNKLLDVRDPKGHLVRFIQFGPKGLPNQTKGKYVGANRVSQRMMHAGIIVNQLQPHMAFYRDILGFKEFWRGSSTGTELSWVNMKLPDSKDYIEFMLYKQDPAPTARGSAHHICLEVPDIQVGLSALESRPYRASYKRPLEARVGRNRKRQLNVFDPDGTRTELMEPKTVDGVPAPSSDAPWPH